MRLTSVDAEGTHRREQRSRNPTAVRPVGIVAGDTVAFSRGLERMTGTLKSGQKFDAWVRCTECYRKTNGHWLAIHDHISVPVDLESGKAALDLKP
jgi:ketosteroid isomerase-like protein